MYVLPLARHLRRAGNSNFHGTSLVTNQVQIKRTVKLVTRQRPIAEPSPMEGFPMRAWSIEIWLLDDKGNEVQANCFEKAVYNLHPSFDKNKQSAWWESELCAQDSS